MAVSLTTYAPFDAGAGGSITEATWRAFMRYMIDSGPLAGILNEFELYADSSGMQVKVKSGECWIRGHWGQNTAETILPVSANATGSTRIDRGVLRVDFNANVVELDVVAGTTSAPTLTQNTSAWEISLGQISVANGAVTIAAGNVTDERSPVSTVRNHPRASLRQTVAQSVPDNAFTSVTYTTEDLDSHYGHSNTTNTSRYTAPVTGVYEFSGGVGFALNAAGARGCRWTKNGTELSGSQILLPTTGGLVNTMVPARTISLRLTAGDYVQLQAYQNSGGLLNTVVTTSEQANMSVKYVGA
jgi:hypothetical protein